jgi:hypothetical protein
LIGRKNLVEGGKIGDGEDGIKIADCEDFFFVNHIDRDAESFAVEITDCVGFIFVNYADRGAVSPYSANFVIIIAAAETANMY